VKLTLSSLLPALALIAVACTGAGVAPSVDDREPPTASLVPTATRPAATTRPSATLGPGCGPSDALVMEADFTPFAHQLSAPDPADYPAIAGSGIKVADPSEAQQRFLDFLMPPRQVAESQMQLILVDDVERGVDPGVRVYYGPSSIVPGESLPLFVKRGGILVRQELAKGQDAGVVVETLGKKTALIALGPHQAAVVNADPSEPSDLRPYHLYWSDGVRDWTIIAGVADARTVIDFARTLYCEA